eukprot:TRINITY_DN2829_c0_g2_i15.p1 TRINITY_DN2829_c0_g2~~TRINITY_DN2829_c0_g2_i15.p1  ORF type:complete len:118 (+),score=14.30 TRINITY_DN2829_c0_g2_i15:3-356(+)
MELTQDTILLPPRMLASSLLPSLTEARELRDLLTPSSSTAPSTSATQFEGKPIKRGGEKFEVDVAGPHGKVKCDLKDNEDGTYAGAYTLTPKDAGKFNVGINLGGKGIKGSPFAFDR